MQIIKKINPISVQAETPATIEAEDFGRLYEQYFKRLYNYVAYRVCNRQIAEDLTSQIFERILVRFATFDKKKASLDVWIFTIARNVVTDHFRRQKFRATLPLKEAIEKTIGQPMPDCSYIAKEANAMLMKALQSLSNKERHIIALKYGSELKNTEIGKTMCLKESTVSVILHRAHKKLKKELEKGGYCFYE